jgi:potassium-dependent mechanosensitive channel
MKIRHFLPAAFTFLACYLVLPATTAQDVPPTAAPTESEAIFTRSPQAAIEQFLGDDWAKAVEIVGRVWNFVLVKSADGKPLVTVGTLVGGIVLLGLGYIAAGVISRWVARKLHTQLRLSKSGVAPLQSLTFYLLLGTFTLGSLNVLHVPIAVFSFLGGALAIGAGFGSQNIVNNFISGLILLVERPIRVADVIELDGMIGTVTEIGARSTKIGTSGNREIIVPNSKLLETNVINWTLTDDVGGCIVKVGVAYGSPTREVERLLKHAADSHPKILREPPPEVIFSDFAADALLFELRFRVNLRQSRKVDVESELRFAIDELFAARGLVIAYPQRDVHLNVLRPVEVRLAQPLSQVKAAA